MGNRSIAIVVSVSMVALIGGAIGFAVYKNKPKQQADASTQQTVAAADSLGQGGSSDVLGVQTPQGSSDGSLQSNLGVGTNNSGNQGQSQAGPSSTDFSQYEQYKDKDAPLFGDIVKGTGTEVAAGTKVEVTYQGWLTNGTMFDESKPGSDGKLQPLVFSVGEHKVIAGFESGIVGMKVGGKRRLIIPPSVGYGAEAQGTAIPANSVLIFDVTLVNAL